MNDDDGVMNHDDDDDDHGECTMILITLKSDILNFYLSNILHFCNHSGMNPFNCIHIHSYDCIYFQIFTVLKYLKPKYSDCYIVRSFKELVRDGIIYDEYKSIMQVIFDTDLLYDILIHLNNDFWVLSTFDTSLISSSSSHQDLHTIHENDDHNL